MKIVQSVKALKDHPVITNSLASVVVKSSVILSRTLFLFIAAKYFAADVFGLLALTVSLLEIYRIIFDFGIDTYSIKLFSSTNNIEIGQQITNVRRIKIAVMGTGYIFYVLSCLVLYTRASLGIAIILGFSLFSTTLVNLYTNYFQSKLSVKKVLIPAVINSTIFLGSTAVCIALGTNFIVLVSLIPICEAVYLVMLQLIYSRQIPKLWREKEATVSSPKKILALSFPLGITAIIVTLYTRLDTILIDQYFGTAVAANYTISYRFSEPFIMIFSPFFISTYSHLSNKLSEASLSKYISSYCSKFLLFTCTISFIVSSMLFIISPIIITYVYPEYYASPTLAKIFCIALFFRILNSGLTIIIQSFGKFAWITYASSAILVSFIFIFILTVPLFGIYAGAVALAIAECLNSGVQLFAVTKLLTSLSNTSIDMVHT